MGSLLCLSMPPLVTSLLLLLVAARTGWFPLGNMSSIGAASMGWSAWAADVLLHLPLPVLALALPLAAKLERLQSQSIAEAMQEPFVTAAAARGLSRRDLVFRHAWRASLRPVCGVYGMAVGALLSGSFVVEYITAWPGLGRLMYDALYARDVHLVAGGVVMGAALLSVGIFTGDVLLALADPRTRGARA
jgi:peptide/nickel transport system permease protein